eukprot:4273671-Pleurochrysis_carterae.AAC.2
MSANCTSSIPSKMNMFLTPPAMRRAHCSSRHQPRRLYVDALHMVPLSQCSAGGATTTKKRADVASAREAAEQRRGLRGVVTGDEACCRFRVHSGVKGLCRLSSRKSRIK